MKGFCGLVIGMLVCMLDSPVSAVDRDSIRSVSPALQSLADYMTGSFVGLVSSGADGGKTERKIESWPIWTDRKDALWLYLDEKEGTSPARQIDECILRLTELRPGILAGEFFQLPAPPVAPGRLRSVDYFSSITPAALSLRDGCAMSFRRTTDTVFSGQSTGTGCSAAMSSGAYLSREFVLTPSSIERQDRTFDRSGKELSATATPRLIFLRVKRLR